MVRVCCWSSTDTEWERFSNGLSEVMNSISEVGFIGVWLCFMGGSLWRMKGVVRRLVWNWKVWEEVGLQNQRSIFQHWSEGQKRWGLLRHNEMEVLSLKVWVQMYCQVWENNGGNSGNSGCQVQTYEMLEGTSASAYVLHPFQTLVPRFQNEKDGGSEWRFGVVLGVELSITIYLSFLFY